MHFVFVYLGKMTTARRDQQRFLWRRCLLLVLLTLDDRARTLSATLRLPSEYDVVQYWSKIRKGLDLQTILSNRAAPIDSVYMLPIVFLYFYILFSY